MSRTNPFILAVLLCLTALAQSPQVDRIQALVDHGDFRQAIDAASRLIAGSPRVSEAYRLRANARRNLNDLTGALEDTNKAVELDPRNARAWGGRSIVKRLLKDASGALADVERALAVQPAYHQGYDSRSLLRQEAGDLAGALRDANRAVELSPQTPNYLIRRAIVSRAMKDYAGAERDVTKAINLDPANPHAYFQRGLIRLDQGNWTEAIADNTRALERKLPNASAAYNNRAIAYKNSGMLAESRKDLAQARMLQANLPAAAPPAPDPVPVTTGQPPAPLPAPAPAAARPRQPAPATSAVAPRPPAPPPVPAVRPPAPAPALAAARPVGQAQPSGSVAPKDDREFFQRANFFRMTCSGSVRLVGENGKTANVATPLGGLARYGFPIQWNGDEFFYSGPSFAFDPNRQPRGSTGGNINLAAGSHLALGKVTPDGERLLSLRFVTRGENGKVFAVELRDIYRRNRQQKFDDSTLFLSNYSQMAAYSKAAELFQSTVRILDLRGEWSETGKANVVEYRPFGVSVSLFNDPEVPSTFRSKEAPDAVRKSIDTYWSSAASWARLVAFTEEELSALFPKRSPSPR